MWDIKYIYDEKKLTLSDNEGVLFLDNNADIAKFNNIREVHQYLKENELYGTVGRRLNMEINNCND